MMKKRLVALSIVAGVVITFVFCVALAILIITLDALSNWFGAQNLALIGLLAMCSAFFSFVVYAWLTLTDKGKEQSLPFGTNAD